MAKMAKKKQTDYTIGGRDISNTAVPYYQENLTRMNTYLQDPTQYMDRLINKYYDNTASQSDFLRNYNRQMANTTAGNYSATAGGYSSSGQRAYDDMQRYQNDLAARLREYGVNNAYQMAQGYFGNLTTANTDFNNAYRLGKEYSDTEQYNDIVRQNNSFGNQAMALGGKAAQALGSALMFVPGVGQAAGIGLQALGGALNSQVVDPTAAVNSIYGGNVGGTQSAAADAANWAQMGQGWGTAMSTAAAARPDSWQGRLFGTNRTVNNPNSGIASNSPIYNEAMRQTNNTVNRGM